MSYLEDDYLEPDPIESDDNDESNSEDSTYSDESRAESEPISNLANDNDDADSSNTLEKSETRDTSLHEISEAKDEQDAEEPISTPEDFQFEQSDELDRTFEEALQDDNVEPESTYETSSSWDSPDSVASETVESSSDESFQESELDDVLSVLDTADETTQHEVTSFEGEPIESTEIDWAELPDEVFETQETLDESGETLEVEQVNIPEIADDQREESGFEEVSSGRGYVVYHPKIDMVSLKDGISQEDALRIIDEQGWRQVGQVENEPEISLDEQPVFQPLDNVELEDPDTPEEETIAVDEQPVDVDAGKNGDLPQDTDQSQAEDSPSTDVSPSEPAWDIPSMPVESSDISSSDGLAESTDEVVDDVQGAHAFVGAFQSDDSTQEINIQEIDESDFIGTPIQDAVGYHEQDGQTCAQVSCEGIIHKHHPELRDTLSEVSLAQETIQDGFDNPKEYGTPRNYIKDILETHDVPAKRWNSANLEDIRSELQKGHDIIVAVDAGVLWDDQSYLDEGHAIRVTGIREDDPNNPSLIYVRDSGNPKIDGMGEIPVDTFQSSWRKMNNFMVTTILSAAQSQATQGESNDI
jgi:hypothetical protein